MSDLQPWPLCQAILRGVRDDDTEVWGVNGPGGESFSGIRCTQEEAEALARLVNEARGGRGDG